MACNPLNEPLTKWGDPPSTVDGKNLANQLISSLSQYLQGLLHPRWCRISSINSMNWFRICSINTFTISFWIFCISAVLSQPQTSERNAFYHNTHTADKRNPAVAIGKTLLIFVKLTIINWWPLIFYINSGGVKLVKTTLTPWHLSPLLYPTTQQTMQVQTV